MKAHEIALSILKNDWEQARKGLVPKSTIGWEPSHNIMARIAVTCYLLADLAPADAPVVTEEMYRLLVAASLEEERNRYLGYGYLLGYAVLVVQKHDPKEHLQRLADILAGINDRKMNEFLQMVIKEAGITLPAQP